MTKFENVREKLSLCYFASSTVDYFKGIMLVSSGIEFEKYDEAKREIFRQLDAIRNGEFSEEELQYARRSTASGLRAGSDSPGALESFYLGQTIGGWDWSNEEYAALCEEVTREDVIAIAQSAVCDAVYFLRGEQDEEAEEE